MIDKCKVCKVGCEIIRSDKPKACAFEHNGDKNICPFDARYLDLAEHDKQIRADAINELGKALCDELDKGYIFTNKHQILHFVEQLKEQK